MREELVEKTEKYRKELIGRNTPAYNREAHLLLKELSVFKTPLLGVKKEW